MSAMYPNTATVWRPCAEGRSIAWKRVGTLPCRFDTERTVGTGTSGDSASWTASIIIPTPCAVPPLQRGDKVALGMSESEKPPSDAYKVTRCDPVSLDKAVPHHWEAEAR